MCVWGGYGAAGAFTDLVPISLSGDSSLAPVPRWLLAACCSLLFSGLLQHLKAL